ncbi:MAG: efflux RND transporter periplasmic adaptor subunit, partial [Acidobacteriota bacterium]
MKRPLLMVTLTVLIIGLGLIGAFAMIAGRPAVETRAPIAVPPLIRALEVQPETLELTVKTQGTVAPRTSTSLVPEVSGRVVRVAPSFAAGGFFKPGDILVEIESHDYEWAVTRARASVAQAELRLAQEEAAAAVARREWEQIGEGDGTPLALRDLQVSEARAALEAARAVLEQARRDLDRTKIRAPFPGRVLEKSVDVGQYVTRGTSLARVYSVDVAEVRLPIPDDQLAYVQLPLSYRGTAGRSAARPPVRIEATFGGERHRWNGRIVRTEGEIDPRTRMVYAIAQVEDPYARGE